MGKGSKPKKAKSKNKAAPIRQASGISNPPIDSAARPTAERLARGSWARPQGAMKSHQPFVDTASDAIGRMHNAGLLDASEEQAARLFQRTRAAYIAELPDVSGYKSCIAGGVPGYDDGDGDPAVIEEYRRLEMLIGLRHRSLVLACCEENHTPGTWDAMVSLKRALRRIAAPVDARKKIA